MRGVTVSDLHLLTDRSRAQRRLPRLERAIRGCDLAILNGDVFDFAWSRYGDLNRSLRHAEAWVRGMLTDHPQTRFVFIMGNHDALDAYACLLDELARRYASLAWRRYDYRLGPRLFLHGDAVHAGPTHNDLDHYRARWSTAARHPAWRHKLYWALAHSRLPAVATRALTKQRLASRLLAYVHHHHGFKAVHDVYYGHVHRSFTDFAHRGVRFHNAGAALPGARMRPLGFTFRPAELAWPA